MKVVARGQHCCTLQSPCMSLLAHMQLGVDMLSVVFFDLSIPQLISDKMRRTLHLQ